MWTVQVRILTRMRRRGRGRIFVPKDFLDDAGREAVDQALARLVRSGEVERLGRGLYMLARPGHDGRISPAPDPDEVAAALARQTGCRPTPSGALAASRLGFCAPPEQELLYLTDGRSRRVRVGAAVFVFKHVPPKELPVGRTTSATVFQALRHLGREAVDDDVVMRLRDALTPKRRRDLLKDARYASGWIAEVARRVADEPIEAALG